MKRVEDIDKNLKVDTELKKEDLVFYDCLDSPFEINGVLLPKADGEPFCRMPGEIAEQVNEGVAHLYKCTAGGRVRFKTDSPYVAIHVEMGNVGKMPHFPFTGSIGLDLYERRDEKEIYVKTFVPPVDIVDGYESIVEFEEGRMRELTINMPLYSGVTKLYIGLAKDAKIEKCRAYKHPVPVVYYGSSITQGGCASRPGNSYQSMISRKLDCDYVNLGFSGNAKGEPIMREYLSRLPMSVFVMDYDHNAPTPEHLEQTHQPLFEAVRRANPDLPIILVSMPESSGREIIDRRFRIIQKTYEDALAKGDRHVYLIDGRQMVAGIEDSWSVDGVHPNDLGFHAMAEAIGAVLAQILE